jgi:hypothetical protein
MLNAYSVNEGSSFTWSPSQKERRFNKWCNYPNNIDRLGFALIRLKSNIVVRNPYSHIFLTIDLFFVGISSYPSPTELEIKSAFLLQRSGGQLLDLFLK